MRRVRESTDCSMIVIEHDMALLTGLCDELVAMELGRVIVRGDALDVLAHDQVVSSYLGSDQSVIQRSGAVAAPGATTTVPRADVSEPVG